MLLLTSQPYGCTCSTDYNCLCGGGTSYFKTVVLCGNISESGSVVVSAFRSPVMSVELFENRMLLVLSGLLIYLPYIIAGKTEDAFLDPQLNTEEGILAVILYIMVLLVVILSIVLTSCCCYFCRMYYKARGWHNCSLFSLRNFNESACMHGVTSSR